MFEIRGPARVYSHYVTLFYLRQRRQFIDTTRVARQHSDDTALFFNPNSIKTWHCNLYLSQQHNPTLQQAQYQNKFNTIKIDSALLTKLSSDGPTGMLDEIEIEEFY